MEKVFSCHDGCQAPVIGKRNDNKKWDLFTVSQVHGMGSAEYNEKLFDYDFDKLIPLNSTSGRSYIGLCRNRKWGLLVLKDNGTPQCEWQMLAEIEHDNFDRLLNDLGINRDDFRD